MQEILDFLQSLDWSPLVISIKTGIVATILSFFFGIFAARAVMKLRPGARAVIDGFLTLPMILPPTVAGFFLLLIFSLRRPFGAALYENFSIKAVQTWLGCILAATIIAFPLMYRNTRAAFEQVDTNLIYAARTLGMSEWKIFWKVVIPSAGPGVLSGTVLAFARALGEYGATSMLAGNIPGKTGTVSQKIAMVIQDGDYKTAGFWSVVVLLVGFLTMTAMNLLGNRRKKNQKKDYLISIKKEMELYKEEFKNKEFTSVFLGGGTPSILTPEELTILMENIYSNFNIKRDAEITMECNPGTLNKVKLKAIKSLGINRLSMGLQVTQDHHLKYIGRIHTYEQFEKNYKDAIEVGIDNINVDLMYSLPNQSFDEWKETLNKIINLNPSHISAYSLILEEGTKFYDMYLNKEFELNDEEVDISIYNYTIDTLYKNGYHQYEISNYAKEGYECKHNIVYWKCDNYLGLGPGASGYINNYRYSNICDIKEYNKCLEYNKKPIEEKNVLSKKDEMEEFIFMGLRMNEGINLDEFYEKFNVNFKHKYNNILDKLKNLNLIIEQNNNIALTQRGRELSNTVFIEFID